MFIQSKDKNILKISIFYSEWLTFIQQWYIYALDYESEDDREEKLKHIVCKNSE